MRLISFNVNGIRAIVKKNFIEDMQKINADIICLQETKATIDQVKESLKDLNGYYIYANEAEKKGYSGTAIVSKSKPIKENYNIGINKHDKEGRVIHLEYEKYHLVNVYVPNSGNKLLRLSYRKEWDLDFFNFLKEIEKTKPVILCGDLNVAHRDLDLARPKQNYNKAAGYMQDEIDGINRLIENGFVDVFRTLHPDKKKYSWWSYRAGARDRNIGWRIDYFLVSGLLVKEVKEVDILNDIYGSDHCPVSLLL